MVDILCVSQITTVCNFFTYIRYIQQGLVKQQDGELRSDWMYGSTCVASCDRGVCGVACLVEQMFWEVMQLRREMSLAKLGYYKDQLWQTGVPAVRPRPSLFLAPPLPTWVCSAWENLALKTVTSSFPEIKFELFKHWLFLRQTRSNVGVKTHLSFKVISFKSFLQTRLFSKQVRDRFADMVKIGENVELDFWK